MSPIHTKKFILKKGRYIKRTPKKPPSVVPMTRWKPSLTDFSTLSCIQIKAAIVARMTSFHPKIRYKLMHRIMAMAVLIFRKPGRGRFLMFILFNSNTSDK